MVQLGHGGMATVGFRMDMSTWVSMPVMAEPISRSTSVRTRRFRAKRLKRKKDKEEQEKNRGERERERERERESFDDMITVR